MRLLTKPIAANLFVFPTLLFLLATQEVIAGGTWTPITSSPPTGVNASMVLSDGTVLTYDGNGNCNRLTPDIHGSYINGTWTQVAAMNDGRLFFASAQLTNGNVFVAGGEYGTGHDHAELYDPLNNVWTRIPDPVPGVGFSDAISKSLPNGNVLVAPVSQFGGCLIYNTASNKWQTGGPALNQNEVCWVKLPNDTIVTIDTGAQTSEHYVPSLNQWVVDGNVPVPVYGYGAEIGAGFLLPNGKAFYIGGNTNTAIYTPGATAGSAGSWVASANIPDGNGAVDAPAAMMANGKILCDLGPVGGFNGPCYFYEYDYTLDTFTAVIAPGGGSTYGSTPFANSMLDLPDGNVLFIGGQNSTSLYVYTPDGTPLAAGQPAINSITQNVDGTFHLTGLGLNGITEGAAYGDDEQMDSNYPLVRLTNSVSGNVYYARTYNWNSTSVQTGSRVVATEFSLPQNLPAGTYSLVVVANGNPSAPTNFVYAPPPVPTGLTAASGSNAFVNLSWNASAGAVAYDVKRSATSGGYYATITTVGGTNYSDTGLTNGLTYYYRVASVSNSNGPSANSGFVSATPKGPPPVPTGLTATGGINAQVPLSWNASYGATNYNLKRSTTSGGPYTTIVSLNATNYTDHDVTNSVTYYYVVTSVGTNGESAVSVQASAMPLAPVLITWFKADAITGVGNGSTLSTWVDSSGHSFAATQVTAGQRPTYVTAAMNGLAVVRFNAANSTSLTFNRPVQDSFTIFCVFRSSQGSGTGTLFYQGAGLVNGEVSGSVNDFGTCLFADGHLCAGTGNPDVAVNTGAGFNDGNTHLMTFKRNRNNGEVDLYMDGNFVGMTTGNLNSLTAPAKLALGAVQTGINFLSGDMGEVKLYTTALLDSDRITQEASLMHKWGVNLPAAPSGLTALGLSSQVQLSWNTYPTATNYLVKRATVSGGPYTTIGSSGGAINYVDATVVNGTTYYYVVSALHAFGESGNSAEASAAPVAPAVAAWFKADAITGLGNGAAVSSWTDSSGHGLNATQSGSQRPTYSVNAINGLPVVHFNSASSQDLFFNRPVQDDFTILCVFRSTQGNGSGNLFWQGAGLVNGEVAGSVNDFGSCLFANGQINAGTGNSDVAVSSATGFNDGKPHLMTFKRIENTGEVDLYVDGNFAGTTTGNTNSLTAPTRLALGAQQTGGNYLTGDIAEVKIFGSALSDASRSIEEASLECKYGITGAAMTLATPTGLNGTFGSHSVALTWVGSSGATGYTVGFSTNATGPLPLVANSSTASYVHTNAVVGRTNYYQVTVVAGCNSSAASAIIGVFVPKPTVAITASAGGGISVAWPNWANDWSLYSSTNLLPPVVWSPVTNSAVNTNGQISITIPIGSDTRFFQLGYP
ncbi:MAG: hypothetical protein JF609_05485 [Verrucomicrobia bacterium]|nr:hypothetical protein [Verrucomicrobiota bacterium]